LKSFQLNYPGLVKTKNVKILGQYYYSKEVVDLGNRKTTNRFEIDSVGFKELDDAFYRSDINISSSATLSEFMDWCKIEAPAKTYLLVVWDHGGCFFLFEPNNRAEPSTPPRFKMEFVDKNTLMESTTGQTGERNMDIGFWLKVPKTC
jgi:hypothetical protein